MSGRFDYKWRNGILRMFDGGWEWRCLHCQHELLLQLFYWSWKSASGNVSQSAYFYCREWMKIPNGMTMGNVEDLHFGVGRWVVRWKWLCWSGLLLCHCYTTILWCWHSGTMKFMRFYKLKRSSNEFTTFNCNLRPETSPPRYSAITMQSIVFFFCVQRRGFRS